jgi:hypothetical protein
MDKDKYYNWENMAVSSITWLMIRWFNFDSVEMTTSYRKEVASRVWITISIHKGDSRWFVDGQTMDIVRTRLIEFLDREKVRGDYKPETPNP